jgi:hypothetical protein
LTAIPFETLVKAQKTLGASSSGSRNKKRPSSDVAGSDDAAEEEVEGETSAKKKAKKNEPRRGRQVPRHEAVWSGENAKFGHRNDKPAAADFKGKKPEKKEIPKRTSKNA